MCPHPPPPRAPRLYKNVGPLSCTKNAGPWAGLLSCTKMWDPGRRRWCRTSSINCIIVRTRFQSSGYRTLIFGFLLHVCSVRDKGNVFSSGTTWRKSLNRLLIENLVSETLFEKFSFNHFLKYIPTQVLEWRACSSNRSRVQVDRYLFPGAGILVWRKYIGIVSGRCVPICQ